MQMVITTDRHRGRRFNTRLPRCHEVVMSTMGDTTRLTRHTSATMSLLTALTHATITTVTTTMEHAKKVALTARDLVCSSFFIYDNVDDSLSLSH